MCACMFSTFYNFKAKRMLSNLRVDVMSVYCVYMYYMHRLGNFCQFEGPLAGYLLKPPYNDNLIFYLQRKKCLSLTESITVNNKDDKPYVSSNCLFCRIGAQVTVLSALKPELVGEMKLSLIDIISRSLKVESRKNPLFSVK